MTLTLGIDPGLDGSLALLDGEALCEIHDMPTLRLSRGGKNRREIDHVELARLFDQLTNTDDEPAPTAIYIERVQSMPGQGVSSSFAFGRAVGICLGAAAMTFAPVHELSPQAWRKAVGLKPGDGKDASRALAKRLWPQHAGLFARVKDEGRADAALLALAGARMQQREAA